MFQITKDRTPVLYLQSGAVQALATQFNTQYASKNSVKVRAAWGALLEQILKSDLNCVNTKGEAVTGADAPDITFAAICRELGIPRSTAYHYINEHITITTYPQVIQDAAAAAGLNLALEHVQAAYGQMVAKGLPSDPSALEVKGIISELQNAKPDKTTRPRESAQARFRRLLKEAFDFANENGLDELTVHETVESLIAESYGMPGAKLTREMAPIYKQGGNS